MNPHVIVEKPVSSAIRGFGLPREVLLELFNTLYDELPRRYQHLRGQRDAEDPDCFRYRISFAGQGRWWDFFFRVNDTRATDYLFVETVDL
jgi:hypothetical protein